MTTEEILAEVWGFVMTVGPILLIIVGAFSLAVFGLVIFIFVKVFKAIFGKNSQFNRKL